MNEHTSYRLSKKLFDAGYMGEHTHVYGMKKCDGGMFKAGDMWSGIKTLIHPHKHEKKDPCKDFWNCDGIQTIPAYTFTELWGELPIFLEEKLPSGKIKQCGVCMDKSFKGDAIISYSHMAERIGASPDFRHESPAEAAGQLMLWLIENGYYDKEG